MLLPEENSRDLEEIDPRVAKKLKIEFVGNVDQVLNYALGRDKVRQAIQANKRKTNTSAQ